MLYDVEQIFNAEADTVVEAKDIGHALQERLLPVFKHHFANFVQDVSGQKSAGTPATYVLAAGYSSDMMRLSVAFYLISTGTVPSPPTSTCLISESST